MFFDTSRNEVRMKTIIIAGAGSKVGKTTVLRTIVKALPDAVAVKLGGTRAADKGKEEMLLPSESSVEDIVKALGREPVHLIIEGNSILKRHEPDLAIFVEGEVADRRADADELKARCDLVAGGKVECSRAFALAGRLGLGLDEFGQLLDGMRIKIFNCQLGCF